MKLVIRTEQSPESPVCDYCGEDKAVWAGTETGACWDHLWVLLNDEANLGDDEERDDNVLAHAFWVESRTGRLCGEVVYINGLPEYVCGQPFGVEHEHTSGR